MKKMRALQRKNSFAMLIAFTCLLLVAGLINKRNIKPSIVVKKQDSALNINKQILGILSMGQKRLITDLFWVVTLLESDLEHYKQNDLNSWLYLRFDSILHLDPNFYKAYLFGGQYLDIVKDDLAGAKDIYLRGLSKFPNDYKLNFHAGFLFAFETKEYSKAIEIYQRLVKMPEAPPYLISVLQKLKYHNSDLSLEDTFEAIENIISSLTEKEDEYLKARLLHDLFRIRAEIDLNCLNSGKKDCKKLDFYGKPYLLINGKYQTSEPFEPYGIRYKN